MKKMKKMLMLAIAATMVVGCSSNDNNDTTPTDGVKDGLITSLTDADYSATSLKGFVAGNITLPA